MISYLYPHTPYEAPEPFYSMYKNKNLPSPILEENGLIEKPFRQIFHKRNNDKILPFSDKDIASMKKVYYSAISCVDAEIGKILEKLEELDLFKNTVIVFTSDYGDYMGEHGMITKSPALFDMAGIKSPDYIDGKSFKPCFSQSDYIIRNVAFSEYGVKGKIYSDELLKNENISGKLYTNPGGDRLPWEGNPVSLSGEIKMYRKEDWKYIEEKGDTSELYNLKEDPNELNNLIYETFSNKIIKYIKGAICNEIL